MKPFIRKEQGGIRMKILGYIVSLQDLESLYLPAALAVGKKEPILKKS